MMQAKDMVVIYAALIGRMDRIPIDDGERNMWRDDLCALADDIIARIDDIIARIDDEERKQFDAIMAAMEVGDGTGPHEET